MQFMTIIKSILELEIKWRNIMSDFKDELVTEHNDLAERADKLSDHLCSIVDYSEDEELQRHNYTH